MGPVQQRFTDSSSVSMTVGALGIAGDDSLCTGDQGSQRFASRLAWWRYLTIVVNPR